MASNIPTPAQYTGHLVFRVYQTATCIAFAGVTAGIVCNPSAFWGIISLGLLGLGGLILLSHEYWGSPEGDMHGQPWTWILQNVLGLAALPMAVLTDTQGWQMAIVPTLFGAIVCCCLLAEALKIDNASHKESTYNKWVRLNVMVKDQESQDEI